MKNKNLKLSFPKGIWEIINKDLCWLGNTESERIQNMVISSIFLQRYNTNSEKYTGYSDITDHIDVLHDMISSTNQLLEEKNTISSAEWNDIMQKNIMNN